MHVSLIPTYLCNRQCDYCYLGSDLIKDNTVITPEILDHNLNELCIHTNSSIELIDIFGGEVSLIKLDLLQQLIDICKKYTNNIGLVTNLSNTNIIDFAIQNNINIAVSLNDERDRNNITEQKLKLLPIEKTKKISILSVALPSIIDKYPKQVLDYYQQFNIKSLSILQYYPGKLSEKYYNISNIEYENTMINLFEYYKSHSYNYSFDNIEKNISYIREPTNNHVFISPYGQYGLTVYDDQSLETFKWYDKLAMCLYECTVQDYMMAKCLTCAYYNKCLAEHIRPNKVNDDCCGLPKIIKYFN